MRVRPEPVLVTALLACILAFGVWIRLDDPLSTRAIAAEDPYTHVVFTKEWMEQGYFDDSFHLGTSMYPPGMHGWLASVVPYTGVSLYDFARIAPAFVGGLAILGTFALALRLGGPAAGIAAAFLVATTPEHIFRTELLFPTAFDLALLPLWLLGFHLALTTERLAGIVLFAGASVPLALTHPWVVPLFAAPLALYAAMRRLRGGMGWREVWLAAALLVPPTAFAAAFRWDTSDTGFSDFLDRLPGFHWIGETPLPPPVVFVLAFVLIGGAGVVLAAVASAMPRLPAPVWWIAGLAVFGALHVALSRPLPASVSYVHMLGWVAIAGALAGLAVAFVRPSPLGDLGIAIFVVLFPLTAVDVFGSPYGPHRTVAYLTLGLALLGGSLVAQAQSLVVRVAPASAGIVALGLVLAGTASAAPVDTYTWYRMYDDDDFAGFESVAAELERDEDARVFVYTWQPALLVKTLTDPGRVWYSRDFFWDPAVREEKIEAVEGPAYVLVDKHTERKEDVGFLEDPRYRLVTASGRGGVRLYEVVR